MEKKKLEEKLGTYPPNTCVLMGDSILNGVIESNISNDRPLKVRKFPGATVDNVRYYALPIIWKQPKFLVIHMGNNHAVKFTSRDILNKLLQVKSFIQEKFADAVSTFSTPTLRSVNGKMALMVRQLTNHLINLKIDILDNKHLS